MNLNIELLYLATNIKELQEAIKVNPNINEIPPKHNIGILEYYILYTYDSKEEIDIFTRNAKIDIFTRKGQIIKGKKTLLNMIELLLKNGAETNGCFDSLMWNLLLNDEVKIDICRLLLNYGAKFDFNIEKRKDFIDFVPRVFNYIVEGYRIEKLRESFCAAQIQNWFLKKYYDPYHPYGKMRLEREFSKLEREVGLV
jgi:hypothetical protein